MADYSILQRRLAYTFQDESLLSRALTHSSYAHEHRSDSPDDSEQLEFLGDAVLGFLVSDYLFRTHPGLSEGELSKIKGFLVSSANLVKFADRLGIGQHLRLGRGEEKTGGRAKQALLVDAFEAVLGAMYLDGGLDRSRSFVEGLFRDQVQQAGSGGHSIVDFKTALQELAQSTHRMAPQYEVIDEAGPDHEKLFSVRVRLDGRELATGIGLSRKAAEQAAARDALDQLRRQQEAAEVVAGRSGDFEDHG